MRILPHNNENMVILTTSVAITNAWEAMDRALRKGFDSSHFSCHAQGYINAAKQLGRNDLAAEMEADLVHELEQAS